MQTSFRELKADIEAAKERLGETEVKLVEVREKNERELKACKLELVERLDRIQVPARTCSRVAHSLAPRVLRLTLMRHRRACVSRVRHGEMRTRKRKRKRERKIKKNVFEIQPTKML